MELASICLFIIFCILIIFNFHKAILILSPIFVLCQPYMCLRYNSPAVSLIIITQFVCLFFYLIRRKKLNFKFFPLRKAYIVIFITLFIGLLVSPYDTFSIIPWFFSYILSYLHIIVYYNEINSFSDTKLSLKAFIFSVLLLLIYSIFEFVTQTNPFIQFMYDLLGRGNGWVYPVSERFGVIRSQSLMAISIAWGGFCCLIISSIIIIKKYNVFPKISNIFLFILVILAILGIFLCGSRSAYIFVVIVACSIIFDMKQKHRIIVLFCFLLLGLIMMPKLFTFINETFGENVAGSSVSMRQMQFMAVFSVLNESPIWGIGIKGIEMAVSKNSDVLGAESIWLQNLINYGFIGIFMQIYLYKQCWNYIKKYGDNSVICKFLLLGWIIFCTITTSPGLSENYFLSILILFCKTAQFSRNYTLKFK